MTLEATDPKVRTAPASDAPAAAAPPPGAGADWNAPQQTMSMGQPTAEWGAAAPIATNWDAPTATSWE